MKEFNLTKKQFLKLIKESNGDINEMAVKPRSGKRPIIMGDDDNKQLVGWDIRTSDENPEDDRLKLLFTCDLENFKENNPNFAQIIQNELGEGVDWRIVSSVCPGERQFTQGKKPSEPRRKDYVAHKLTPEMGISPEGGEQLDLTQKTTGIKRDISEKIRIKLYNILRKQLQENATLNERFKVLQIPKIIISRANSDRYAQPDNNDLITYGTHTALLHKNIDEFIDSTVAALTDDEDYKSNSILTYLARQYNKSYRNWNLGRLSNVKKTGLTPVYKLNRLGFEQEDYGVLTVAKFRLEGQKRENDFVWTIEFQVKFGLLQKGEEEINMLQLYRDINETNVVHLAPDFQIPEGETALDNDQIYDGLIGVIDKFENDILTLDPQSALDIANLEQYDRENKLAFTNELQEMQITKGEILEHIRKTLLEDITSDEVNNDEEKYDDFVTKGEKNAKENRKPVVDLQLAKDQNGNFYLLTMDPQNPKVVVTFN